MSEWTPIEEMEWEVFARYWVREADGHSEPVEVARRPIGTRAASMRRMGSSAMVSPGFFGPGAEVHGPIHPPAHKDDKETE